LEWVEKVSTFIIEIKDKKFNIENRFTAQDNLFSIQAIKINNSSIAIDFIPILKT
jgi:hypothetical protein